MVLVRQYHNTSVYFKLQCVSKKFTLACYNCDKHEPIFDEFWQK